MHEDDLIEDFVEVLNKQASIQDLDIIEADISGFDVIKVTVAYPDISKLKEDYFLSASNWRKEILESREWKELKKSSEPVFDANIENFIEEYEDSLRGEYINLSIDVESYLEIMFNKYLEDRGGRRVSSGGAVEVTFDTVIDQKREFITREWLFEEYKAN